MNKYVLEFTLEGEDFKIDIVDMALIKDDLNLELKTHSAGFAYYAAICEAALADYEKAKEELIRTEAVLFTEFKKTGVVEGTKATEKLIESAIKIDEERMEAKRIEMAKKELYRKLLAGKEALVHKKDHLSSLSANLRKEIENS